jgi:uncharacterized protein involved in response to NO
MFFKKYEVFRMAIPAALSRRRDYAGPALFSYGFRPFFLGAAIWAAVSVFVWLPVFVGEVAPPPTHLGPLDWHIHEMLYGYVAATVTGFLLTAIPNWTGRLPVNGTPLAALVLLWLAGRIAMAISAKIGATVAVFIDVSFLAVLFAVAAREIVAGKNWRNLRVLVVIGVFIAGNIVFHLEVLYFGVANYGVRIAIAAVVALISLIGGRIVPSFTGNWLTRNNPGRMPAPFSRFDMASLGLTVLALLFWIADPGHAVTGVAMLTAGVLQLARLSRWAGDRTLRDRLVLVLHVGYAFIPAGFLLIGASALLTSVPPSAGIHAWTAGGIGLMTLAVMTRASLGHTGHALAASVATQVIYACAFLAAVLRIVAAFNGDIVLLHLAVAAWVAAFGGFALAYGPMLIARRPAWQDARC